jgi:hypothetical protein
MTTLRWVSRLSWVRAGRKKPMRSDSSQRPSSR